MSLIKDKAGINQRNARMMILYNTNKEKIDIKKEIERMKSC